MPPDRSGTGLRGRLLWLLCAGFLALYAGRQVLDVDRGQLWWRAANYTDRQKDFGYAVAGRLGRPSFPAVVTARLDGAGELAFTDTRGQKRHYRGFAGYDLKVVTFQPLDAKQQPFMLVLRRAA